MSGGAFGTVVLHVAPESAVGGPLAAVKNDDIIHLDVDNNLLEVELSEEELRKRLKSVRLKEHNSIRRGYVRHFIDNVLQVNEGCDMQYL